MANQVYVFDPTLADKQSSVRGIGRYLQTLRENFPGWTFVSRPEFEINNHEAVFINPFFNFLQPPLTFKRITKKQIAVIHDLIPLKYPKHFPAGVRGNINIFLNKIVLKNYDLIITDSEASKKDIVDILRLPDNKIKVIYPCLPKDFSMKYKVFSIKGAKYKIPNTKYCLYVGDATWNKNIVNMARAIKIADITCVLAGKVFTQKLNLSHPWQAELRQFLIETNNDKRFIFAGYVPDSELFNLYKQSLFNVLPSWDEGFGFSFLEAANFGCPSLLSDIPVLREISAGNAFYTDPKSPEKIAKKILEINNDKIYRKKLSDSAKKRATFFSSEKFKKEFLSLI